jgi:formylglycine-generating enzyme required for sulfatase activity
VVGVSWYEATAYCVWLTAQGHRDGWLLEDAEIRLPTSLEWERAARHIDQRRYPWGDAAPTAELANYDGTGIGLPSPVGCFPNGAAACGAEDLAGNVREWMATSEGNSEQSTAEQDFPPNAWALMSYSDHRDPPENLLCNFRFIYVPFSRNISRSFRVICSPRST